MKPALLSLVITIAFLSLANTHPASAARENAQIDDESRAEAERLWEQAIAAKGGRERLRSVKNMLVSIRGKYPKGSKLRNASIRIEEFYVFPGKLWLWGDERPSVLGLSVNMWNYARGIKFLTYPNDSPRKLTLEPMMNSRIADAQLFYLMETEWLKPIPIGVTEGRSGGRQVNIVHTLVGDGKKDFMLDPDSHLPIRVVSYSPDNERPYDSMAASLSDYAEVDDIKMPQGVGFLGGDPLPVSFRFNVEYDEQLFEQPPTVEAGPEAWKKRSSGK